MNRLIRGIANKVMNAFVGAGVSLGDEGQLNLPDGLSPERVHRFIEFCMDQPYPTPRAAMHSLFSEIGVPRKAVHLLDVIIDEQGDVEFGHATRHGPALLAAIPDFQRIPVLFRDFLVNDLGLASTDCTTLEDAVASTRVAAAAELGCEPSWEAILEHGEILGHLARPWRERNAAA